MLKNKVVLITGSSQGIGKATALAFASQGAFIVLNGRNADRLLAAEKELAVLGATVLSVVADVTFEAQAKMLIEKTIERFGRLDVLINNAGISMRGDFESLNPSVFSAVFQTNVIGVTNLSILAMPFLKESKGSLVFISSLAAIRGLPGLSAYCASKMALRAIAESIRIEEHKSGLHVGLIQVGFTEIEFAKETMAADGSFIKIKDRSTFKVQSKSSVAKAVLKNVKKRKFITTLSGIGKLNAFLQAIAPSIVEKVLIHSVGKIKERS